MNKLQTFDKTIFEHVKKTNDQFTKHFHDTYTIGITHDGEFKSLHEKKTFYLYKNSTKVINPGEVHGGDSNSWKYTNFYPSIELVSQIYEQVFFEKKSPIFTEHTIDDIVLCNLLRQFFINTYSNSDKMETETSLITALSYLIKNYTHKTKTYEPIFNNKPIIKNSIEFIQDSLETNISLDDLALVTNLSKYHFLRTFKNTTGLTPHQYILIKRVEKGKELISKGINLNEIAYHTGFSDQSHFNRSFKRVYGYSPKTLNNNIFNTKL
ncbi:AraC family transcriptional regulator [Halarcobacter sp.]|uniref:AraC family transcriptional regulator n=1 Tax=Halarcobacter sp. TaxID=2321133 RepID=UPI0029F4EF30|nr:AraC family transcriptional regulator [Halarcobacter sp.]